MDETNGPIFDHHDELFAQIGSADAEQQLKDFVLEMTGSSGASGAVAMGPSTDQLPFPMTNNCLTMDPALTQRGFFPPNDVVPFELQAPETTNTFLDSFVKTMSDDMLDNLNGLEAIKRSLMALPDKPEPPAPLPATMHRISTDNGTQEYLDNLSKPDTLHEHPVWNGVDHLQYQPSSVNKSTALPSNLLRNIDRNGNCPLPNIYHNGLPDRSKLVGDVRNHDITKARLGFSPGEMLNHDSSMLKATQPLDPLDILQRELSQSFLKSLSPSVSAESGIHTSTTSYDSGSPLSSSRTPLRSDDSISPLASTDCFSPGRVRRVETPSPAARHDGSPIVRMPASPRSVSRTPLRPDDALSPRGVSRTPLRMDDVPSPRAVNWSALRGDDALSPRTPNPPVRNDEAPSPRAPSRTPLRIEEAPSPRPPGRTPLRVEEVPSPRAPGRTPLRGEEAPSPRAPGITPLRVEDVPSPRAPGRTPVRIDEAPSPRAIARTPLRPDESPSPRAPVRTPVRTDESPSPRVSAPSSSRSEESPSPLAAGKTPSRTDDAISPRGVSRVTNSPPLVRPDEARAPFSPGTVRRRVEDPQAGPAPGPSGHQPKKRQKTENVSGPTPRKRWSKKMPIYQSSVSGEESGIKLKLKLTAMPPPKRRRKRAGEEEVEKHGKRKKKPPSPAEQSPWGESIPVPVLERIFRMVVDEEGCVPSLVRYSWVCRLWNSVATTTELWQNVDLSSPCIKQKCKIDRYFRWLLENRLGAIRDLNLNGWKFSNLPMVLTLIGAHCSEVESIGLSGWQGLHFEHLRSLLQDCPRLARIDLSDVSPESKSTNSAVSPKSITYLTETMADRLTEITLAHNTLSCLPQIISSLASNCPNLEVLDLSNIRRASHAEFALHVEELQTGCPKLRVLRITNSCITIAAAPLQQQAASPGFPMLEELSIAGHQGTESLRITSVMDDDCLERIVKTSHKLRLLDVRGCTRITESSLVRVPAWDIQHLFLSGCLVTRQSGSGLELIAQKWSHSLVEVDLAWASVAEDLNAAVLALAERGQDSPLRVVNLCGSAVEPEPIKSLLTRCSQLESLNLQSCRGLPRGVKRLYERHQLPELLELLQQSSDTQDEG